MEPNEKITWAPKVQPRLIQKVYEQSAIALLDEGLLDDLGIRLLLRCESIVRAMSGEVECPRCGHVFKVERAGVSPEDWVPCPLGCGWQTTVATFRQSKRHRELNGASNVLAIFQQYVDRYPKCHSDHEKLIAIDRLLHEFHWDARLNLPNRSISNNLIEGSHRQVVAFLDSLSAVDLQEKERWEATVAVMWRRRHGQL